MPKGSGSQTSMCLRLLGQGRHVKIDRWAPLLVFYSGLGWTKEFAFLVLK